MYYSLPIASLPCCRFSRTYKSATQEKPPSNSVAGYQSLKNIILKIKHNLQAAKKYLCLKLLFTCAFF